MCSPSSLHDERSHVDGCLTRAWCKSDYLTELVSSRPVSCSSVVSTHPFDNYRSGPLACLPIIHSLFRLCHVSSMYNRKVPNLQRADNSHDAMSARGYSHLLHLCSTRVKKTVCSAVERIKLINYGHNYTMFLIKSYYSMFGYLNPLVDAICYTHVQELGCKSRNR